jgi:hypothetical protein
MDIFMASQSDKMSPVQCPPNFPWPGKVDLEMTNGLLFGLTAARAVFVTMVSVKPNMLCRS